MNVRRLRMTIEGIVQGVGFRPFVFQIARRHGVAGWVLNDSRGVVVEAEGSDEALDAFRRGLRSEIPPLASISRIQEKELPFEGAAGFTIRSSLGAAEKSAQISPDTWVCPDCLRELFDPADRRYRYPFINCTNCGPRYTIVTAIPYDRPNTTMVDFPMCRACLGEYEDPDSRRFHAQPNACPDCGPGLFLLDAKGSPLAAADPVEEAISMLRQGRILAVKGLGGYHLVADAQNDGAVTELRRRKARDEKPFALMVEDLASAGRIALVDETEGRLLAGTERPIVLLPQKVGHGLSPNVAPGNLYFGVMLPYTPLHYLLLQAPFRALVMTSGNLSDEPIAFDDSDAVERLAGIADATLAHNRRIHIRTDDSIARMMGGRPLLLRRSRGYVPRSVLLPRPQPSVLAVGGELKNTVCLTRDDRAFLSHHVGDLKNPETYGSFEGAIGHLAKILDLRPEILAHDLHPDYDSTRYAREMPDVTKIAVQHHHAHMASCLAENGTEEPAIGVIFDGIGYGDDGRIWGGEFLVGDLCRYHRGAHLAYVPMPGGDAATKEPARMALAWLRQAYGSDLPSLPFLEAFAATDLALLMRMMERGINSPLTSSCGRLFDAVAALCGLRSKVSYEGQAALELEMVLEKTEQGSYPWALREEESKILLDPAPVIREISRDLLRGAPVSRVSARFHNALAEAVATVCALLRERGAPERVVLSGGVFQNHYLTERTADLLRRKKFAVLTHSLVPPNDGGLALGQAVIAGRQGGSESL